MVGRTISHYQVLDKLGEGGMGVVYRAHDTRLNRDVAVKVLPPSFAADKDRLRRFTLEAQSAGALNHPNILAIYDIGTDEGVPYMVSELLEGESLRARLKGGKLGVQKAVDFARQAAAGLAAAHAKGITHRDIKPENLFITKDGHVKILDFGLAKVKPSPVAGDAAQAETETVVTSPGVVLGTVAYMSPEQVRGQAVDHRSDIFSLGSVLYEMLAGRRAFRGTTSVETMNAILKEEPAELSTLDSTLAPALERIVRHCLEKRPEERFQSVGDLAFNLEALSQTSSRVVAKVAAPRVKWRLGWVIAGVFVMLALAAGYFAGARSERPPPKFQRLTFRRGLIQAARFTPDGNSVVYAAAWEGAPTHVFSVRLDSPEFHPTVASGSRLLSVSRLGKLALLLKVRASGGWLDMGTLAEAPLSGGAPREMLENVEWADWSPNGEVAVVRRDAQGDKLEFPLGNVLFQTGGMITHPRFSPAGDQVAFLHHPNITNTDGDVVVVNRAGQTKILSAKWYSVWGLAWHPKTNEIWFTATQAGSKHDLRAATLSGSGRTILTQAGSYYLEDISRDGRVLLNGASERLRLQFVGGEGMRERDLSWLDWSLVTSISADRGAVVFFEFGGGGRNPGCYYRKTDGSPPIRLGDGLFPVLSPDGTSVLAVTLSLDGLVIFRVGPGESRRIPLPGFRLEVAAWMPGARGSVFAATEPGRGLRLYSIDLEGGKPRPLTPEGVTWFNVLASGTFAASVDAKHQVVLYPVAGGDPVACPGTNRGDLPLAWSADEKHLYVFRQGPPPLRVYRVEWRTGRRELWKEITPPDPAGVYRIAGVTISPDGRAFAYSYIQQFADLHLVEGLK
jgi:predicted Ser/Thr protein kinase